MLIIFLKTVQKREKKHTILYDSPIEIQLIFEWIYRTKQQFNHRIEYDYEIWCVLLSRSYHKHSLLELHTVKAVTPEQTQKKIHEELFIDNSFLYCPFYVSFDLRNKQENKNRLILNWIYI